MRWDPKQLWVSILFGLALTGGRQAVADDPPANVRIVNTTADSAPGWAPSPDQAKAADAAALAYLVARDAGRAQTAYAMLETDNRQLQPFPEFSRNLASFNLKAGAVVERRVVNVTWTKDSPQAPKPGVYAAIDIVSRFSNIDRDCGYLVMYQSPSGGPFLVGREEVNFLTNSDATTLEHQKSRAALDAAWSQLTANCPNYPGEAKPHASAPLPEQADSSIGYSTVAAALSDLRSRSGVTFSSQGGYTIANDDASKTIWVFTSEGQPAYPAVVKRQFVTDAQGGTSLSMNVLCEASKAACDDLVLTFEALNARMTADLSRSINQRQAP